MAYIRKAELLKMIDGTPPVLWTLPEAASQSFVAGDLVYLTGGYVTICGSDPAAILGIAMEDAHNTTAGAYNVEVLVLTDQTMINMCVDGSTDEIEATDRATAFGVSNAGSGIWVVDKGDTTNDRVTPLLFVDPVGTEHGRVGVTFLASVRQV